MHIVLIDAVRGRENHRPRRGVAAALRIAAFVASFVNGRYPRSEVFPRPSCAAAYSPFP